MTIDDLELLQVRIFSISEFRAISRIWKATTAKRMKIDLYCQWCIDCVDIAGRSLLGVYNHNTEGENGDFQPLHPKISRYLQTVSNAAPVIINHQ